MRVNPFTAGRPFGAGEESMMMSIAFLRARTRLGPFAACLLAAAVFAVPAAAQSAPPVGPQPEKPSATLTASIDKAAEAAAADDKKANGEKANGEAPANGAAVPATDEQVIAESGLASFFRSTELTGFLDGYFGYNFNKVGDVQLRNFDTKHNQFSVNLAEIALERKASDTSRLGFRFDFNVGQGADISHSGEPGGPSYFRNLQQGYVTYLAPIGKGLQVDVGKFVTPHGAEVIETKDNWNYSRSLLFALAIPYYHMGARVAYPVHEKLTVTGFIMNGWNNVVENNSAKTVALQALVKPTAKLTVAQNYIVGAEQADDDDDYRQVFDTVVSYAITDKLSVMGNYDFGRDRLAGVTQQWQGVAGYLRAQINDWWALSPRVEWFEDRDGFTTGLAQTVKEVTITSEQKLAGQLLTRIEFRRDMSDEPFFLKSGDRLVKSQNTMSFGFVYAFSSATK